MNNYFDTFDKKDCNGCGTCALRCPKGAITMKEDEEGFFYPVIDEKKCINCGLCKKICPNITKEYVNKEDTYIAVNKNKKEKKNSSSGGMFYPIAKYIIEHNGVVFGVILDDNLIAHHEYYENIEDIKKFQGSKYVRSDIRNSYIQVEKFLKENRYVLFTGTPCQCNGLKGYLMKDYEKLITCEIVCHANPSPKIFKAYLENIEIKFGKKVKNIYFRSKENGWRCQIPIIEFEDDTKIEENSYFKAFVNELINRPSCYDCRFCTPLRYSDFSIADFWGIEKLNSEIEDDDTGISLLNVNTDKARNILSEIKSNLDLISVNTEQAFGYNHHKNVPMHKNRKRFFAGIEDKSINETNIIKYMNKYTRRPVYKKVLGKLKKIIKIKS